MASPSPKQPKPDEAQHGDDPWDVEAAEALMRAYEESEAEWRESRSARRPPHDRGREISAAQAAAARGEGDWLEGRLADIAERLQRSIAGIDPDRSTAALAGRIDELEHRLSAAFEDIAQRLDGHSLKGVEAQIGSLATRLEDTRTQLARLDNIDERLRDLAGRLDQQRQLPERAPLSDSAIEALIEQAANRAATRVVETLPPAPQGIDPQRFATLESMLREQMAERRQTEEMTTGVLRSVEEALGRILDRVDSMEPANLASILPESRGEAGTARGGQFDPLLEAYVKGARAMGQDAPVSLLDAADYATNAPRAGAPAADRPPQPDWGDLAPPDAPRAGLPQPDKPGLPLPEGPSGAPGEDPGHAKAKPSHSAWRRSSMLLGLVMTILFGAGYQAVDSFLAHTQLPAPHDRTAEQPPRTTKSMVLLPAAASGNEVVTTMPIAPSEGARPYEATGVLPEEIGASSLRTAALNGDPVAQFEIATRFGEGRGVVRNDAQAYAWFQRAASHGYVPAQFRLAGLLERGTGVAADAERAKVWYRRAAEQGHVKAMHNLAVLSAGKDVKTGDYATAAKWFRQAAEHGLADSQYNLALLCQKGLGVPKSLPEAYVWFGLAARGGDPEAAARLQQVKGQLDPAELADAEQRLATWRAQAAVTPAEGDAEVGG